MSKEQINSWILFSMRSILEETDIRNAILQEFISNKDIVFGPTFTGNYDLRIMYDYLVKTFKSSKVHLFTASNLPDKTTGETHFQTFVYTNGTVFVADPSYTPREDGIYNPAIGEMVMSLARNSKLNAEWIQITSPCQTSFDDVFCQTWSLMIQIEFVTKGFKMPITIPCSQDDRYSILHTFYKRITEIPAVRDRLREEYRYNVENAHLVGVTLTKKEIASLLRANPVSRLEKMTFNDMY